MMRARTRNPRIWFEYGCWVIHWWMRRHTPDYPVRLRRLLMRWPDFRHRSSVTWPTYRRWQEMGAQRWSKRPLPKPLPWWIGPYALGPFRPLWHRIANVLRNHTGGRSHRCEFTDPEHGALWGHDEGAFMDGYFDTFLTNISETIPAATGAEGEGA